MDRLEEELLAGFDEDGETFEFAGPWLKSPADRIIPGDPSGDLVKPA